MIMVMVAAYFLGYGSVRIQAQKAMNSMKNIITEKIVVSMIFMISVYIRVLGIFLIQLKTALP